MWRETVYVRGPEGIMSGTGPHMLVWKFWTLRSFQILKSRYFHAHVQLPSLSEVILAAEMRSWIRFLMLHWNVLGLFILFYFFCQWWPFFVWHYESARWVHLMSWEQRTCLTNRINSHFIPRWKRNGMVAHDNVPLKRPNAFRHTHTHTVMHKTHTLASTNIDLTSLH